MCAEWGGELVAGVGLEMSEDVKELAGRLRNAEMLTLARIYKALNAFPRHLTFIPIYSGKAPRGLKRKAP